MTQVGIIFEKILFRPFFLRNLQGSITGMKLLQHIDNPADLKKLDPASLPALAREIREYIIDVVSEKKGHLGAGLGVVELSIALHYVYDTPGDILIWDVGHQAYPHKILTGRREAFRKNRQKDGPSGFPRRSESPYDAFGTGHSSTSISALLGMAVASSLEKSHRKHIAVIGDASIAAGMAFEALNHAGDTHADLLIILNDNQMGIDPHVGALKNYLTRIKQNAQREKPNLFENLNFRYTGPIDGHDLPLLIDTLREMKSIPGPKLLHIITTKGKGLPAAERDQTTYHAPEPFDKKTGLIIRGDDKKKPPKYQDVFGLTLVELARQNDKIIGITPAMPTGTSLKYMLEAFPGRAFDVGIAEQHALTFAAGLSTRGFIPYVAIYSTFLQRAYDQLIHDIAVQDLPVVLCIDRAGLVGRDGATHHGVFDMAFLRIVPNMIIAVPRDEIQLRHLLYTAQYTRHPFAIRYPRGRGIHTHWKVPVKKIEIGTGERLKDGEKVAWVGAGPLAYRIKHLLDKHPGYPAALYDLRFVKPLDEKLLHEVFNRFDTIISFEDGVIHGGLNELIGRFALEHGYHTRLFHIGVPDSFIQHGSVEELYRDAEMDDDSLLKILKKAFENP